MSSEAKLELLKEGGTYCCKIFPVRVSEHNGRKRTNLLSFENLCGPIVFFGLYFVAILAVEPLYHDPLIKWATTGNGIAKI